MNESTKHLLQHTAEAVAGTAAVAGSGWVVVRLWKKFKAWISKPSLAEAINKLSGCLDGIRGVLGALTQEMRNTSEALHLTNLNVQILLDNDPVARWWTRPDGSCASVNQSMCNLFGMTKEEMTGEDGHGWMRAVYEEHRAGVLAKFKHAMAEGIPYSCTFAIVPRGRLETVLSEGEVIRASDGKIITVIGTVRPLPLVAAA